MWGGLCLTPSHPILSELPCPLVPSPMGVRSQLGSSALCRPQVRVPNSCCRETCRAPRPREPLPSPGPASTSPDASAACTTPHTPASLAPPSGPFASKARAGHAILVADAELGDGSPTATAQGTGDLTALNEGLYGKAAPGGQWLHVGAALSVPGQRPPAAPNAEPSPWELCPALIRATVSTKCT